MTIIRIYGDARRIPDSDGHYMKEVKYTDYDITGRIVGTGTEDFSLERLKYQTRSLSLHSWHGAYRKDGSRSWTYEGMVRVRRSTTIKELKAVLLQTRCKGAEEIELRCT